jgi:hypothetical protein
MEFWGKGPVYGLVGSVIFLILAAVSAIGQRRGP